VGAAAGAGCLCGHPSGRRRRRGRKLCTPKCPVCLLVRMCSFSCCFCNFFCFRAMQSRGLARGTKAGGLGFGVGLLAWAPKESPDTQGPFGSLAIAAPAGLNVLLRRNSGVSSEYCGRTCSVQMFSPILQGRSAGRCCREPRNAATASASPVPGVGDGRGSWSGQHRAVGTESQNHRITE